MSFIQQFPRDRDCYVIFKGDAYTVSVSKNMMLNGWQGGQGVRWVDSDIDEFIVDYSDGIYGGFMLWGSNESSDQYNSLTGNQPLYGFGTFCAGGWLIACGGGCGASTLVGVSSGRLTPISNSTTTMDSGVCPARRAGLG